MRIMAIDYGDVRTGFAVSDASATLAGEAWVLSAKNPREVAETIARGAIERSVTLIVVGYPKNMDGSEGARAKKSAALAELIRTKCDIEVILWDERMTTISAHRILSDSGRYGKKRKKTVDAVAASLILESYLDSLK